MAHGTCSTKWQGDSTRLEACASIDQKILMHSVDNAQSLTRSAAFAMLREYQYGSPHIQAAPDVDGVMADVSSAEQIGRVAIEHLNADVGFLYTLGVRCRSANEAC